METQEFALRQVPFEKRLYQGSKSAKTSVYAFGIGPINVDSFYASGMYFTTTDNGRNPCGISSRFLPHATHRLYGIASLVLFGQTRSHAGLGEDDVKYISNFAILRPSQVSRQDSRRTVGAPSPSLAGHLHAILSLSISIGT